MGLQDGELQWWHAANIFGSAGTGAGTGSSGATVLQVLARAVVLWMVYRLAMRLRGSSGLRSSRLYLKDWMHISCDVSGVQGFIPFWGFKFVPPNVLAHEQI